MAPRQRQSSGILISRSLSGVGVGVGTAFRALCLNFNSAPGIVFLLRAVFFLSRRTWPAGVMERRSSGTADAGVAHFTRAQSAGMGAAAAHRYGSLNDFSSQL